MNHNVDVDREWKLLTLFIMSNDLCLGCTPLRPALSADAFELLIRAAIERVRASLPRTMVVLVSGLNISGVYELTKDVPHCIEARNAGGRYECACAFDEDPIWGPRRRADMDELATSYNQRLRSIVLDYQKPGATTDDFAVILEPGFEGVDLKKWPVEMLSTLDCFHPSILAHSMMAERLFNNLHRPLAGKKTGMDLDAPRGVLCPTEDSRIWTR